MSENIVEPDERYAIGAIVRIKLKNFMTYDSLEFRPRPNLNVIIGYNGTGKSTIVCAIFLCMTGKPAALGRATNLNNFIKRGKRKSLVEIELNNPKSVQNHVIRLVIFKNNTTDWFLNGKAVDINEIEDLVNDLNIQVENLCQFLPQEKVSEFARMDSQQLLESTEKAIGGLELCEIHNELIHRSELTKLHERELRTVEENLSHEEDINRRLENQVKSYEERQQNEEQIKWLKRKRACLYYKEKRYEFETEKKNRDRVLRELQDLLDNFEPVEERKQHLDKEIEKLKKVISGKSCQVQEYLRHGKDLTNKLDDLNEKLSDFKNEYSINENEFKKHKTDIERYEEMIELRKAHYDEIKLELTTIQESKLRAEETESELCKQSDAITNKKIACEQEMARNQSELDEILKKITEFKNVREDKLRKLRERAKDVYVAMQWLEKNKRNLRGRVYDPLFFMINIKLRSVTKYVENAIPVRDLTSLFLFENSDDMHYFLTEVRDHLNLIVNAALVPNKSLGDFKPPRPLKEIETYGFHTYLLEAIDAPEPILVYLCMYSSIHQVPVGTHKTQQNISSILPHISEFNRIYTHTHQYTLSKSRYTSKVSSSSIEVAESFWLASSMDQSRLDDYENRQIEAKLKLKNTHTQFERIVQEKQKVDKLVSANKAELQRLNQRVMYIKSVEKSIADLEHCKSCLKSQNVDFISEARKMLEKVAEFSKLKAKVFKEYVESARMLVTLNEDKMLYVYKLAQLQNERLKIELEIREHKTNKQELEYLVENCLQATKQARENAKLVLEAGSKINEINLEEGLSIEYKHKFATLPETIQAIEAEINQLEALAQCALNVDEKTVQEYENRKIRIENLRTEFEKNKKKLENYHLNYETMKNEWLTKVETMINDINVKFSILFKKLKCTGEVCLSRPDNPEDFAKYGISIKVSFRCDEKLQELTSWQQSGGEKSVSTMLYMIALQEMTKCPFRVVDEINQGMDPINERKVFDIIMQNSCSKHQVQYFLVTPKLLHGLNFDDRTNIICVLNGPYNLHYSSFNLKNIIEARKKRDENKK